MATFFDAEVSLLRHPSDTRRHAVRESLWYAAGSAGPGRRRRRARWPSSTRCSRCSSTSPARSGTVPGRARRRNAGRVDRCDGLARLRSELASVHRLRARRTRCATSRRCWDRPVARASTRRSRARFAASRFGSDRRDVQQHRADAGVAALRVSAIGRTASGWRPTVERLYRDEGGFREFNSPTYYGVDLWGLALWRRSSSPRLVAAGQRLEAALWRDIATFYHAGTAQPVRALRSRVWHGYDAVRVVARACGCGGYAATTARPFPDRIAPIRARARLLRHAAARARAANDLRRGARRRVGGAGANRTHSSAACRTEPITATLHAI